MSRLSVVNKEQAIKLKELGFNWGCVKMYGEVGGYAGLHNFDNYNKHNDENDCSAPDIALALKWCRDEKKIFVDVQSQLRPKDNYTFSWKMGSDGFEDGYKTFEEAESEGLDFVLSYLLKQNK